MVRLMLYQVTSNGPFDYDVIAPTFGVYEDDPRKYCFQRETHEEDKVLEMGILDSEFQESMVFPTELVTWFPGGIYATRFIEEGDHYLTRTFCDIEGRKGVSVTGIGDHVPSANAEFPKRFTEKDKQRQGGTSLTLAKRPQFLAWVKEYGTRADTQFIDGGADAASRVEGLIRSNTWAWTTST
ncbi:MAG: hypothetical protein U5N86_07910 [Planctomycetota bacterium]|nr:hypothetical protein [Planctomycetota bacterium]